MIQPHRLMLKFGSLEETMKNLLAKLNGETSAFILVQFTSFAVAIISALVLNVWAASANSSVAKEAAILSAAFGFMVAGLCDFFIHRGTSYPKMIELKGPERVDSLFELHEYEKVKSKHSHSWIVVTGMIFVWINVTRFVWDGNFTEFTPLRRTHLVLLYLISSLAFMLGAKLGSSGWGFLIGKQGYVKKNK